MRRTSLLLNILKETKVGYTSMTSKPVPVILCGRDKATGGPVTELIKPEIEVVRFINSTEVGKKEIPVLLAGQKVDPSTIDEVGTLNFERTPQAIIFGGAFTRENIEEMREACGGKFNVPWLQRGPDADARSAGQKYPEFVAKSVKAVISDLQKKGLMEKDGIYFW
eukprot:TRINITY_DN2703_c0_g1_i1.p1 TRINITY_DN2703_c0_g1~~TRINITY_DN2703_c0_g1_i1.p1  ORF type:complete len:166 (-),score=42.17 TRINITY_DN2703_c0_g1_i1:73-570(-)